MITFDQTGDFKFTEKFLQGVGNANLFNSLEKYGQAGVAALASVTPTDTGATAAAWSYKITKTKTSCTISWSNARTVGGTPLVILLQYGHGTGTGGYVQGRDFINPAIKPIFDQIAEQVWKEVTSK